MSIKEEFPEDLIRVDSVAALVPGALVHFALDEESLGTILSVKSPDDDPLLLSTVTVLWSKEPTNDPHKLADARVKHAVKSTVRLTCNKLLGTKHTDFQRKLRHALQVGMQNLVSQSVISQFNISTHVDPMTQKLHVDVSYQRGFVLSSTTLKFIFEF